MHIRRAFDRIAANFQQIAAVIGVFHRLGQANKVVAGYISEAKRYFLDTADVTALALLDRTDELRRAQEIARRAGIEPSETSA